MTITRQHLGSEGMFFDVETNGETTSFLISEEALDDHFDAEQLGYEHAFRQGQERILAKARELMRRGIEQPILIETAMF
jgi:hypothetical protein